MIDDSIQRLEYLESVGLIRQIQAQPELEYLFRHALVQDAAYESLLLSDRHRLHLRVAETLERLYPDRLNELAPVLGYHFALAGNDQDALKYFKLAGDGAAGIYANAEAVSHYSRALEITNRIETDGQTLTDLYTNLGRALELDSQFDHALATYEALEKLANQRNDRPMLLTALIHQAQIRGMATMLFDPEQGEKRSQRALTLAQNLADHAAEAKILWILVNTYRFTNRPTQALDSGERALALARQFNLREQLAYILNDLSHVYNEQGRLSEAIAAVDEASDLWRTFDNRPLLADSLATANYIRSLAGDYDRAIALSEEALEISQEISNIWGQSYSQMAVGLAHWHQGDIDTALATMEASIQLGKQAGFQVPGIFTQAWLALLYGELGEVAHGLNLARLALDRAETIFPQSIPFNKAALAQLHILNNATEEAAALLKSLDTNSKTISPLFTTYILGCQAELALIEQDYQQASALNEACLARLRQMEMQVFIPEAYLLQSQIQTAMGQFTEAYENLIEAKREAEALNQRWTLWEILARLIELEPNKAQVRAYRQQAQKIITHIANHISAPELRASFLNLPDVQKVMEAK